MRNIAVTSGRYRLRDIWLIFMVLHLGTFINAQTSLNDCSGAIEVCGNGAISSNATGSGLQEILGSACSSMEHHSLWIKIEVTKAGTLGFTLTPTSTNLEVDYDFFVFGPNVTCGSLGAAIRCSTTNPLASSQTDNLTGMNDHETDTSEGPGAHGTSFVKSLDVLPGETYYIAIDRPIGQSPFDLEWTGTSTLNGTPFPEGVEVNQPNDLVQCGINGEADFDIFSTRSEITSQPQTQIEYYAELAHAIDRVQELPAIYTSTIPEKSIFARVENLATGCSEIVDFSLVATPGPAITTQVAAELCDLDLDGYGSFDLGNVQEDILSGLSAEDHSISFFNTSEDALNRSSEISSLQNISGGTLYARVEEIEGSECFSISEINLNLIEPIEIPGLTLENLNVRIASRKIIVPLKPEIEYAVNNPNGPYVTGPELENVPAGMNTLYIRNAGNCAITSVEVLVPEFAAAFTPNNDGINDNWYVSTGTHPVPDRPVRIYDRYGKLLVQFLVNEGSWNGTLNGRHLPPDDYWFEISLPENLIIKGHFSLLR